MTASPPTNPTRPGGVLDLIERIGNRIPEPAVLFALFAALVIVVAAIGSAAGWSVQPVQPKVVLTEKLDDQGKPVLGPDARPVMVPKLRPDGRPETRLENKGDPIQPRTLLTSDGIYWMISSMVRNFTTLPALGLVFVSMLGIGLAEKFGLFGVAMRALALVSPKPLLTPIIIMVGANSALASDAGYIILPPLAAALYAAVGRSPVAGLAAAFSGVAGGFCAGFSLNATDTFMSAQAMQAAHIIDTAKTVEVTSNWYFKAASVLVLALAGWLLTDRFVEPRLLKDPTITGTSTATLAEMRLSAIEKKGLALAGVALLVVLGTFVAMMLVPGWPLNGTGQPALANGHLMLSGPPTALKGDAAGIRALESAGPRWSHAIVPMMFLCFLIPGMVYGLVTGTLRSQKDLVDALYHGVKAVVPVLVIAFFLGQFVEYFKYTQLDRMLAYAGGQLLVSTDLPVPVLIVAFVALVVLGDFAMSGLMSKFAVMAPIFIPMFMFVGVSPELMMAGYRIGDSVVNTITPLNSYALIVLAVLQKYKPGAGLGTQIALMTPYSVVYFLVWTAFLVLWYLAGLPLGPAGPLTYHVPH